MFTLDTHDFPESADAWNDAIERTLRGRVPRTDAALAIRPTVTLSGEHPDYSQVDIELSGGTIDDPALPDVTIIGAVQPGPSVDRFYIWANPVRINGIAVHADLLANRARFDCGRNAAGAVVVTLQECSVGHVSAHVVQAELEAALLLAARAAATAHGVTVERVQATLTTHGPRELDVELRVTATKFVNVVARITGHLSLDAQLNVTASNLNAAGEGMGGSLAVGFLRPVLQKLEGRQFKLSNLPLGGLSVREVIVSTEDGLRVVASFGTKAVP